MKIYSFGNSRAFFKLNFKLIENYVVIQFSLLLFKKACSKTGHYGNIVYTRLYHFI